MAYLSWIGVVISRSNASWGRLRELHQTLTTELDVEKQLKIDNPDVSGLTFLVPFWNTKLPIIISEKKKTVFVSNTGHGKTEVLLKMADILKLHHHSISYIAQDPYVFNDTILKNIFLGREVTTELLSKAKLYLKILRMDYLNPNLDELLNMEVGENGKRLSGGQAKRLCLIRSLLSEADILIWDDPFSSVDLILEKEILTDLNALAEFRNKTILLTSHRLSTVRQSDELIFLDKEEGIVESGLTSKLLNTSSKTNEYFQKQMV
jgi:ATP-binding cassette subfamily B protein